ncbi:MAG: hypothetical protein IT380_15220 [Myxococcales bacterium]|nr:hypothetical protein [Myxococcales bacterium]
MTTERRRRRSQKHHEALTLFFETAARRLGLDALALTTDDGRLIAGARAPAAVDLDVEWMGNVGASKQRAEVPFEDRTLFVRRLSVNDVFLFLTSAGREADRSLDDSIRRILA